MNTETWLFICEEYDEKGQGETFERWLECNFYNAYKWYLTRDILT